MVFFFIIVFIPALNPDKSDYTNFIFTSETQSRQKQTKKQTKQKQNRSNI